MSTDLHTLSGAYAIDALSSDEAAEFRTHLEQCSACRDEVVELLQAAAIMGASEATQPPTHLKARVLAAVDKEAQLPPKVRSITSIRPRRWTPRLLTAAAAVILVVTAGIGISHQMRGGEQPAASASVTQVFNAPDRHVSTIDTTNGGKLTVATSNKLKKMAVDTSGLKKLSTEQVYQLWAIADGKPVSVGLVTNLASGAEMDMPAKGTQVAITIEPAGGSAQPTTDPVARVDPSQV